MYIYIHFLFTLFILGIKVQFKYIYKYYTPFKIINY